MTTLSIASRDILRSLTWYMSARQAALHAALSFRTPLSISEQRDMRTHYSGYFANLLAAIDLFCGPTALQPNFETQLCSRMVFDEFQDGAANYAYIRELRNAIVHRGLDITSSAHIDGNFPKILAVPEVRTRPGTKTKIKTLFAFDKYLLDVIAKCESVVGPTMLDCLNNANFFEATIDPEAAATEFYEEVVQSHAMPDHVKAMALAVGFKPEWAVAAHNSAMTELREALEPCDTAKPSVS